jgi:hypothetical protein
MQFAFHFLSVFVRYVYLRNKHPQNYTRDGRRNACQVFIQTVCY